jgi:TatD DNase family protein
MIDKLMYVDTHTHLYFDAFEEDRETLIASFDDDKLDFVVSVGIDIETSVKSIELANKYSPKIYAVAGYHPSKSASLKLQDTTYLEKLLRNEKVVALGEIGLDYYRNYEPIDVQKKAFISQMELAKEVNIPVVIHNRDSHDDVLDVLESFKGSVRGIMHSFSGSYDFAKKVLDLGYYISINGIVTFKNATTLREIVKEIPPELLLSETDCPFLTPQPYRGRRRNQPAYVKYVVKKIAEIKGIDEEELAPILLENAKRAFRLEQ